MKVHVLSDIHLEDGHYEVPDVDADVVVMAGDIGVGIQGVLWAQERYDVP